MNDSTHDPRLDGIFDCLNDLYSTVSCGICLETLDRPLSTKCGHSFCKKCIHKAIVGKRGGGTGSKCPLCNERSISKRSLEDDEATAAALALFAAVRNAIERDTNDLLKLTAPPFGKNALEMADEVEEEGGTSVKVCAGNSFSRKDGEQKTNFGKLESSKLLEKEEKSGKSGAKKPYSGKPMVSKAEEENTIISSKRGKALREISNTKSSETNSSPIPLPPSVKKRKRDNEDPENLLSSEDKNMETNEDVTDKTDGGFKETSEHAPIRGEPAAKKIRNSAKGNRIAFQLKGKVSGKASMVKKKSRQRERKIPFILMGSLVKELETPSVSSESIKCPSHSIIKSFIVHHLYNRERSLSKFGGGAGQAEEIFRRVLRSPG